MKSTLFAINLLVVAFFSPLFSFGESTNDKSPKPIEIVDDQFISEWTCLDGISVEEGDNTLKLTFENEPITPAELWSSLTAGNIEINNQTYAWNKVSSISSKLNFLELLVNQTNVFTYALADLISATKKEVILGVGSDDLVKIWLNGELIHDNWGTDGLPNGNDFVSASLKKGNNQITVKVLNGIGSWGLTLRSLTESTAQMKFADAISSMQFEALEELVGKGLDINAKNSIGLTGLQVARLDGMKVQVENLIELGADPSIKLPSLKHVARSIFNAAVDEKTAGLAYLIGKNGKVVAKAGIGKANVEEDIDITTETKFRIGSVTKQFTAIGILLLQEQGLLSIEDSLCKFIPDFPKGEKVTVRHLLNHTSGIYSYTSMPDFVGRVATPIELSKLIDEIKTYDYYFEPGESWSYSNSGYLILGSIIESVSGKSLDVFLREQIFEPLGMDNTGVYDNSESYEKEALGYGLNDGKTELSVDWDMSWAGAAGAIYSTVEDLFLWIEALHGGKILNAKNYKEATTPGMLANGEVASARGVGYGFGLFIGEQRERETIYHGGGLHGFLSMTSYLPSEKLTYITLSNSRPSNLSYTSGPTALLNSIAIGLEPYQRMEIEAAESGNFDPMDYVGEYDYGRGVNKITTEEGKLFAQFTNQRRLELFHSSGDLFYFKAVVAEIDFTRDESGQVIGATHKQNGNSFKVKKMASVTFIDLQPEVFEAIVGEYELIPNISINIFVEEGKLFAQGTGQGKYRIMPLSKREYREKDYNTRMIFNEDAEGIVESFTLVRNGRETLLKRK